MTKADSCSDFLWILEGITELIGSGKGLKNIEILKLLMDVSVILLYILSVLMDIGVGKLIMELLEYLE